jgi:hypothetical protein
MMSDFAHAGQEILLTQKLKGANCLISNTKKLQSLSNVTCNIP